MASGTPAPCLGRARRAAAKAGLLGVRAADTRRAAASLGRGRTKTRPLRDALHRAEGGRRTGSTPAAGSARRPNLGRRHVRWPAPCLPAFVGALPAAGPRWSHGRPRPVRDDPDAAQQDFLPFPPLRARRRLFDRVLAGPDSGPATELHGVERRMPHAHDLEHGHEANTRRRESGARTAGPPGTRPRHAAGPCWRPGSRSSAGPGVPHVSSASLLAMMAATIPPRTAPPRNATVAAAALPNLPALV